MIKYIIRNGMMQHRMTVQSAPTFARHDSWVLTFTEAIKYPIQKQAWI